MNTNDPTVQAEYTDLANFVTISDTPGDTLNIPDVGEHMIGLSSDSEVAKFLERPIAESTRITSSNYQKVPIRNDPVAKNGFKSHADCGLLISMDLMDFLNSTFHWELLRRYLGFRCDLTFSVKVNVDKFTAGALFARWVYAPYELNSAGTGNDYRFGGHAFACNITTSEGCWIQYPKTQTCEINVPFLFFTEYIPIAPTNPMQHVTLLKQYGRLEVWNMTEPTTKATTPNFEVTVIAKMQNIQLFMPNGPYATVAGEGDETTKEAEAPTRGILEESAAAVETVGNLVARAPIPIISKGATMLSWVADKVKRTAALFGWSRPDSLVAAAPYEMRIGHNWGHAKGAVQSNNLGLFQNNRVNPYTNSPNTDEMSYSKWVQKPILFDVFPWSSSNDGSSPLKTYMMTADWNVDKKKGYYYPMPLQLMPFMNHFTYSGTMVVRFTALATMAHSGRVGITILYANNSATADQTVDHLMVNSITRIWDIQAEDSITMELPYIDPAPLRETNVMQGELRINVLNSLVGGDAASDSINVMVERWWKDDVCFGPMNPSHHDPGFDFGTNKLPDPDPTYMAAGEGDAAKPMPLTLVGTVGEIIESWRTACKVPSLSGYVKKYAEASSGSQNAFSIENPYQLLFGADGTVLVNDRFIQPEFVGLTWFELFNHAFGFRQGGWRLFLDYLKDEADHEVEAAVRVVNFMGTFAFSNGNWQILYLHKNPTAILTAPAYSRLRHLPFIQETANVLEWQVTKTKVTLLRRDRTVLEYKPTTTYFRYTPADDFGVHTYNGFGVVAFNR